MFDCNIITISRITNTSLINYVEFLQGLQRHNSNADFFYSFMKSFYIIQGHNVALERDQKIALDL